MARVLALTNDLLFGSRIQGDLSAAGHEVELVADGPRLRARLTACDVLVVDLTDPDLDGPRLVEELFSEGAYARTRVLGFYAHVDTAVRERAEQAGFDLVVPRSRMAREGAALVSDLAD
jgi:CheY-like chemotaxis protein